MKNESPSTARSAARVSAFCAAGNFALSAFKLAAGVIGHSGAMISDGIHSASDVLGSLIAAGGVKLSERPADASHPYGHERLECIAALFLAGLLLTAGIGIGFDADRFSDITSLIARLREAALVGPLVGRIAESEPGRQRARQRQRQHGDDSCQISPVRKHLHAISPLSVRS